MCLWQGRGTLRIDPQKRVVPHELFYPAVLPTQSLLLLGVRGFQVLRMVRFIAQSHRSA